MGKITEMSELLSSKIAAGEVVDRPASVVKELMENSIDAGATRIDVFINEGGKRLIRVVDNGSGMDSADMALAFKRHATSKLTSINDLDHLLSLGFRGEALSSITSVAKVTLKSRRKADVAGRAIKINATEVVHNAQTGCAPGTSIEVSDLFFNTPVRAKFLRSVGTEFARITDIFKKIALAHTHIGFKLQHGSSRIIETSPGSLRQRVAELYGSAILDELMDIEDNSSHPTMKVTGLIGKPTLSYPTGRGLMTYINKRPIKDAGLTKATVTGYSQLLDRGRYPFAVLLLDIDPALVDVNVHPAKHEVRFKDPGAVFSFIRVVINKTLGASSFSRPQNASAPNKTNWPDYTPQGTKGGFRPKENAGQWRGEGNTRASTFAGPPASTEFSIDNRVEEGGAGLDFTPSDGALTPEFLDMEFIGQLWGEFILCQSFTQGGSFYILDQHAAAERVRFERLKKEYYRSGIKSQLLLLPERVETDPTQAIALNKVLHELNKLGFETVPFGPSTKKGGETFMIKSTPVIFGARAVAPLVIDLASDLAEFALSARIEDEVEKILMTIACHSVIRGARMLGRVEAGGLLKELSTIDFAGHCPHGRPIIKRYGRGEVESIFART